MFPFLSFPDPEVANFVAANLDVANSDVANSGVANLGVAVAVAVIENEGTLNAP
jgi:hypothetical protein